MIIHLFPKSQFVEDFIFFINENFNRNDHQFILYTNTPFDLSEELYSIQNVYDFDKKGCKWLLNELKKADRIILHNLSVTFPVLLMICLKKKIIRKSVWLIWGGDLYCYRNKRERLTEKIVEYIRASAIKELNSIATITEGDYDLAREWYHIEKNHYRVDYIPYKSIQGLTNMQRREKFTVPMRIMIGNSATRTNNHIEVFNQLKKVISHDMEIMVPLSYGDEEYAIQIAQEGKKQFGNLFIPIREYMTKDAYFQLINTVDVAVFNNDRQQATGNIIALAYLGKKIYMRTDTTMWEEYVIKQGYCFSDIRDLENDIREKNIYLNDYERRKNQNLAEQLYSVKNRVEEWDVCFGIKH